MRLTELEPEFMRHERRVEFGRLLKPGIDPLRGDWKDEDFEEREHDVYYHINVDKISEAQGIMFLCPKCFVENRGSVGTHRVLCWRPCVSQDVPPVPGRWEFSGTGYEDLTLTAGSSSILLQGGCGAHFFITNGEIR